MKVAIEKCERYEDAGKAVEEGLKKLGGIESFVKKGEKVLIKPNLLGPRKPEEAVTTHPEVVRALIKQLKKVTEDISIGESPGFVGGLQGWGRLLEKTGMKQIADEEKIKLVRFKTPKEVENRDGMVVKKFLIAEESLGYDKTISVAKLKTHCLTVYTGAVKNMFGIIPGNLKSSMHARFQSPENFSKMLLDLYMIRKAELNIIDGVEGMEGQGPNAGDKKNFGMIAISEDALALDYAITKGLKMEVPMIKIAEEKNMIGNIEVEGKVEGSIKMPRASLVESLAMPLAGRIRKQISSKPKVMKEKCTKCANCFGICPVGAISMKPYPEFDYDKCIRCYCCHEVCPEKAIFLKKSLAQKMLGR